MPPSSRLSVLPFPRWSTTTAAGSRVSCTACCLPLPLGCLTTVVAVAVPVAAALLRRHGVRG